MKYKTSRLNGGFVLFYIEKKLSAKVEKGFPRLWPSKFFRCEFRKWQKNSVRRRCSFEIMPDANEMQPTEKCRLEVCFLYRKLHGSLEVSISFASISNFR